jgi:transglutaminase-like putative cysteine protease
VNKPSGSFTLLPFITSFAPRMADSKYIPSPTPHSTALFIGVLLNVILTVNRPARARVTTVAAILVVLSWSTNLYADAADVLHEPDSTYSRLKKSFAVVVISLLICGDAAFLVLLGRAFSVDRVFGWWPLSDPFSDILRRRQARCVVQARMSIHIHTHGTCTHDPTARV